MPPDAAHAFSAWSSWSWMSSRASSSKSSCFFARSTADWSASTVALAWSCVASRISPAWFVVFCAPVTVVALTSRVSAACCEASWPCCCSSTCRAGASSTVASTSPAVTFWPTLTSRVLTWPPLRNPRFCSVTALSAPDDVTAVVTLVRSTRAVGGVGGPDDVVHATSVPATSTMGTAVRATRRSRTSRGLRDRRCRVRGAGSAEMASVGASTATGTAAPRSSGAGLSNSDRSTRGIGDGALVSGTRDPPPGDEGSSPTTAGGDRPRSATRWMEHTSVVGDARSRVVLVTSP